MTDLSIAEIIGNDKAEEELRKRALDELVSTIMDGKSYPKFSSRTLRIDLDTILQEADTSEVSSLIRECLFASSAAECSVDLREGVEALVKRAVNDTSWHERMIEQIAEEDRE
jgi:hypothetical protein